MATRLPAMTSRQEVTEPGSIPNAALMITLLSATSIEDPLRAFIAHRFQQRSRLVVAHGGPGRHRPIDAPVLLPFDLIPDLVGWPDLYRSVVKSEIDTRTRDEPGPFA